MNQTGIDISLDTLIEIINEKDLSNTNFFKKLIRLLIKKKKFKLLRKILNKYNYVFIFGDINLRQEIIEYFHLLFDVFSLKDSDILKFCRESIFGNVLYLTYFIKKNDIITPKELILFKRLLNLKYITDVSMLELIPKKYKMILDLDERVKEIKSKIDLLNIVNICEFFFESNLIERNRENVISIYYLYKYSDSPDLKIKEKL
ncbi:MAG: hypothetical protein ACTSU6_01405, partial [Candidatus Njordarchaeales archaeon]